MRSRSNSAVSFSSGPSRPPTSPPRCSRSVTSLMRAASSSQVRWAPAREASGSRDTWSRSRSRAARSSLTRAAFSSAAGSSESRWRSWPASASLSRHASGSETASAPGVDPGIAALRARTAGSRVASRRPWISVARRSRSASSTRPPPQTASSSWSRSETAFQSAIDSVMSPVSSFLRGDASAAASSSSSSSLRKRTQASSSVRYACMAITSTGSPSLPGASGACTGLTAPHRFVRAARWRGPPADERRSGHGVRPYSGWGWPEDLPRVGWSHFA